MDNTSDNSTVIGAFQSETAAQSAITMLQQAGFSSEQIGVVARDRQTAANLAPDPAENNVAGEAAGVGASTGGLVGALGGLLIGLGALVIPGIGPIIAGGAIATALTNAAVGAAIGVAAGGVSGALIGLGIPDEEAAFYNERFAAGDILLTVNAGEQMAAASEVLAAAGATRISDAAGDGNPAALPSPSRSRDGGSFLLLSLGSRGDLCRGAIHSPLQELRP